MTKRIPSPRKAPPIIEGIATELPPVPPAPETTADEINRRIAAGEDAKTVFEEVSSRGPKGPCMIVTVHFSRDDGSSGYDNVLIGDESAIETLAQYNRIVSTIMKDRGYARAIILNVLPLKG